MPSFDVVSQFDKQELTNAVDQASREVGSRFDFKDSNAKFELKTDQILLSAQNDFQVKQMKDILITKLAKRNIDVRFLEFDQIKTALNHATQIVKLQPGLNSEAAKKLSKIIKDQKFKVQVSIQGDELRVSGKNRDDLQLVIQFLRKAEFERPLQYINFRD